MMIPFVLAAAATLASRPVASIVEASIDTTIAVGASTKFRLETSAGKISIRVWDRSAVRVVATARAGTAVHVDATTSLVNVWSTAGGRIDEADFTVTIPRKMAVSLGSGDVAIDVSGSEGEIIAKNYSGNISVDGGRGSISLKSTLGEIDVRGAKGRVDAQSMHAAVRLTDVVGDVGVESSSYHLYLTRVDAHTLTASTVGGVIWFTGPLHDDGHYAFTSHAGSIILSLAEPVNATVSVSTVSGGFSSAFPSVRQEGGRRGRFSIKIGTGAAIVDVETFGGGIILKRVDQKE